MNSIFSRAHVLFFFALSMLAVAAAACALSYFAFDPPVQVELPKVEVLALRPMHRYIKGDIAIMELAIESDLTALWNWNVKQVFVWVTAQYVTKNSVNNTVVLWDRIIQYEDEAYLSIEEEEVEYPLIDVDKDLRSLPVQLTLQWDVMPNVGFLKQGGGSAHNSQTLTMPARYSGRNLG
eukprot:g81618.t1